MPIAWAHAHPFGDRYAAQRLEVDVDVDAVDVILTADVPTAQLEAIVAGDDAPQVVLERLPFGLRLTVDGAEIPMSTVSSEARRDLVDHEAWLLTQHLRAEVDLIGRHVVQVGNANLADTPNWFRTDVTLPAGSWVHDTTLRLPRRTGRVEALDGRWIQLEGLRSVRLDVEVMDDPLHRAWRRTDPGRWSLDQATIAPGVAAWRAGRSDPWTWTITALLLAAGAAVVGALAWARARR